MHLTLRQVVPSGSYGAQQRRPNTGVGASASWPRRPASRSERFTITTSRAARARDADRGQSTRLRRARSTAPLPHPRAARHGPVARGNRPHARGAQWLARRVLRAHLARVEAELERLQRLRTLLAHASSHADQGIEPEEALATIEAMSVVARRGEAQATEGRARGETEARWRKIGEELRECMDAGDDVSSPRVRAVAKAARAGLHAFAGGDRATLKALAHLRRVAPPKSLAGWDSQAVSVPRPSTHQPSTRGGRTMMNEQIAREVGPAHLDIAYERHGDPSHPTVLLVMGVAAQLVNWPVGFIEALVTREAPRDALRQPRRGALHALAQAPPPDLPAALKGDLSSVTYTLSDMAARCGRPARCAEDRLGARRGRIDGRRDRADDRHRAPRARAIAHVDDVHDRGHGGRAGPSRDDEGAIRRAAGAHSRRGHRASGAGLFNRRLAGFPSDPAADGRSCRARLRPRSRRGLDCAPGRRDRLRRAIAPSGCASSTFPRSWCTGWPTR